MQYDYYKNVLEDVKEALKETDERDYQTLYDDFFVDDSITGNASGSYTFSTWEAEENLCHNMDLLREAQEEFGFLPTAYISKGAEWADVTIRCYLLGQALEEALKDLEEED